MPALKCVPKSIVERILSLLDTSIARAALGKRLAAWDAVADELSRARQPVEADGESPRREPLRKNWFSRLGVGELDPLTSDECCAIVAAIHDTEFAHTPRRINPWGIGGDGWKAAFRISGAADSRPESEPRPYYPGFQFAGLIFRLENMSPRDEDAWHRVVDIVADCLSISDGPIDSGPGRKRGRPPIAPASEAKHKKIIGAWNDGKNYSKYEDCARELGVGYTAGDVKVAVDRERKRLRDAKRASRPVD